MDVIESTLQERGSRYGTLTGNGTISQKLKDIVRDDAGWDKLGFDQKEAIDNIFLKLARAISGDPNYADNWLDIEGFARLVREKIERVEKEKEFVKDELEKKPESIVVFTESSRTDLQEFTLDEFLMFYPLLGKLPGAVYDESNAPQLFVYIQSSQSFFVANPNNACDHILSIPGICKRILEHRSKHSQS